MSDIDAFIRAIQAAPADQAPKLVYADWLDEHDEPRRAEMLRGFCKLPEAMQVFSLSHSAAWLMPGYAMDIPLTSDQFLSPKPDTDNALTLRIDAFAGDPADDVRARIQSDEVESTIRQLAEAFKPSMLQFDAREINGYIAEIILPTLKATGIKGLAISHIKAPMPCGLLDWLLMPDARFLEALEISDSELYGYGNRNAFNRITAQNRFTHLKTLTFRNNITYNGDALEAYEHANPPLAGHPPLSWDFLPRFTSSAPNLEKLHLTGNDIGKSYTDIMALQEACTHTPRLRVLDLTGNPLLPDAIGYEAHIDPDARRDILRAIMDSCPKLATAPSPLIHATEITELFNRWAGREANKSQA